MSDQITVYSKAQCPQCDMTKRVLDQQGISYEVIDIEQNQDGRQQVLEMGHRSVPVVVAGKRNWFGFRPDLLSALAV